MASAERRIALCVGNWSSDSTLFSWSYVRDSLLRRVPTGNGTETGLSPDDKLFIIHVGDRAERKRTTAASVRNKSWDAGGPITHSLTETLSKYEYSVVELQGNNMTSTILDWAMEHEITLLVMGLREVKGGAMIVKKAVPGEWGIGSLSDSMLQHTRLPLLVIPADAVRCMGRVQLRSEHNSPPPHSSDTPSEQNGRPQQLARALSPPRGRLATIQDEPTPMKPLRVAIVTGEGRAGPEIMRWAARNLLQPADQVHLLHVLAKSDRSAGGAVPPLASEAVAGGLVPLKPLECSDSLQEELLAGDWGAEQPQGINVVSKEYLKGDAKDKLLAYAEQNPLDMIIIGRSLGNRLKMALTPGGTVSRHLVTRAPCPTLVLPYKALGIVEHWRGDLSPDQVLSPRVPSPRESYGVGGVGAVDVACDEVLLPPLPPQVSAPAVTGVLQRQDTPSTHSLLGSSERTLSEDYLQHLTDQLSERDRVILALKEEVRQLKIATAQPIESIPE